MKTIQTNPDIEIIFEDNHLLVVNKPSGVLSQEDHTGKPDILTLCKKYLKKEYNKPGDAFLGLLHRLDRPVSGVMVLAKTSKAASRISEQIRKRSVKKRYLVVVEGSAPPNAFLTHFLKKNSASNRVETAKPNSRDAKEAKLMFEKLDEQKGLSLLQVTLITGRAHQIRVQLAAEGYPIWGDQKYGKTKKGNIALHAFSFQLNHPTLKKEQIFSAKPPENFPWSPFNFSKHS
ncbi:pseudouridine synthase [Rhodohalobacter halophilus]|uniref:pseudouridine synthase n=1 Tax=Rhodohalobacter halophilus TaxID=1812810 RepID=UPI00083FCFF4